MMAEINKLVGQGGSRGIGWLDEEDYERTVQVLLAGGSDPVITKKPEGAWSHAVFEAMGRL
jgi:NitT/TauT family transport system substrate-binding protein